MTKTKLLLSAFLLFLPKILASTFQFRRRLKYWQLSLSSTSTGSMLSLQRPTANRVSKWFSWTKMQNNNKFNYNSAGMTNPTLQVVSDNSSSSSSSSLMKHELNNSTISNGIASLVSAENCWWPSISVKNKNWKVLTWRCRVGRGKKCYEDVRDKILQWEFHHKGKGKEQGIFWVNRRNSQHQDADMIRRVRTHHGYDVVHTACSDAALWNNNIHGHAVLADIIGGPPKTLVTYTRKLFVWIVNPVQVLYEVIDQRAPSTVFTSTAYGTLRGHWLHGEERVTVALRDTKSVDIEITSCSSPSHFWWMKVASKMGLLTKMQSSFFESQMQYLETIAKDSMTYNNE